VVAFVYFSLSPPPRISVSICVCPSVRLTPLTFGGFPRLMRSSYCLSVNLLLIFIRSMRYLAVCVPRLFFVSYALRVVS
jgi:hypothetical protein